MEVGASAHINIVAMQIQEWQLLLVKQQENCYILEYETSIAQLAHRVFQRRITPVTEIGMHPHHR